MAALTLTDIPSFAYTFAGFLSGEDVLTLRHVSSRVKSLVDEESEHIFDMLLGRDFGLLSADLRRSALRILPEQNGPSVFGTRANDAIIKCSSAFECWLGWKRASWRYDPRPSHHYIWAPYFLRAARVWARIEKWLSTKEGFGAQLLSSLAPGVTRQELMWPPGEKERLQVRAAQAVLSFYVGGDDVVPHNRGLFGGFSAYDFAFVTRLCGHWVCDAYVDTIIGQIGSGAICLGMSGRGDESDKFILVHPGTGRIYCVGNGRSMLACSCKGEDAVLVWLEEYSSRLETGYYGLGQIFHDQCILLYPQHGQEVSRTVTRGIEVVASAVFSPTTAHLGIRFVYSIQLRLLEPDDDGYDLKVRGFETCQLHSRHWRIELGDGQVQHVDGDGVVGLYPLLREGSHRIDEGRSADRVHRGEEVETGIFRYQSCTNKGVAFGGYLLFVPGSLEAPTGPAFEVAMNPFPLNPSPSFIF